MPVFREDPRLRGEIRSGGMNNELIRVALIQDLTATGSSARAVMWKSNGESFGNGTYPFKIYDSTGSYKGSIGDVFWVVYKTDTARYEIVSKVSSNRFIEAATVVEQNSNIDLTVKIRETEEILEGVDGFLLEPDDVVTPGTRCIIGKNPNGVWYLVSASCQ